MLIWVDFIIDLSPWKRNFFIFNKFYKLDIYKIKNIYLLIIIF